MPTIVLFIEDGEMVVNAIATDKTPEEAAEKLLALVIKGDFPGARVRPGTAVAGELVVEYDDGDGEDGDTWVEVYRVMPPTTEALKYVLSSLSEEGDLSEFSERAGL